VLNSSEKIVVRVTVGQHSYPVIIGHGLGRDLETVLSRSAASGRVFVVLDAGLYALHGKAIEKVVSRGGREIVCNVIPSGEKFKTSETVGDLHGWLLAQGISRGDFVLAVGGGVTSDVVGFAASTVLRGVRWGICTTTLLGMVDAAIGGKTGVNHGLGKNLIGSFWQPSFVIEDLDWLSTLDSRQFMAGMGELVKTTFWDLLQRQ
jgi:3-dehydroquinate synthase